MKIREPSLFWRTFGLIQLLLLTSILVWFQSFLYKGEEPLARSVGNQVAAIVSIVQQSIENTDPSYLPTLLERLSTENGIGIIPKRPKDTFQPLPISHGLSIFEAEAREQLPAQLRQNAVFASEVTATFAGKPVILKGLLISISIDGDSYWFHYPDNPLERHLGWAWMGWLAAAILMSVFGAAMVTRYLTEPLIRLSNAARTLGQGKKPEPLSTDGPVEIRNVNTSFNRMVEDLEQIGHDREVLLAGISHDLRTPLTRLRLETEMADLPDDTRAAMVSDMEQMNAIVDQFLAYSRGSKEVMTVVDLAEVVENEIARSRIELDSAVAVSHDTDPGVFVSVQPSELARVVQNLITNAMRYGRNPDGTLAIAVAVKSRQDRSVLVFADTGTGIPEDERSRVLRPFERGETARSNTAGSGLGLSIVDRCVRRWSGTLELRDTDPHGLTIEISLPAAKKPKDAKQAT